MLHLLWLLYQHSLAVPRSGLSIRCLQQAVDPWMWRLLWWWWWCSAWVGPHIWAHSPYWGSATVPLQWMLLQRHPTSTSGSEDLPLLFTFKKFPALPPAPDGLGWAARLRRMLVALQRWRPAVPTLTPSLPQTHAELLLSWPSPIPACGAEQPLCNPSGPALWQRAACHLGAPRFFYLRKESSTGSTYKALLHNSRWECFMFQNKF